MLKKSGKLKHCFETSIYHYGYGLITKRALSMDELKLWNDEFSTEKRIEYMEQPVVINFEMNYLNFLINLNFRLL